MPNIYLLPLSETNVIRRASALLEGDIFSSGAVRRTESDLLVAIRRELPGLTPLSSAQIETLANERGFSRAEFESMAAQIPDSSLPDPPPVSPGNGDDLYPNQPEGWLVFREQEWHSLVDNTGITWAGALVREGEFRLNVSDPTSPDGTGIVAEVFFPEGMPDGTTPGRVATQAPTQREVFIGDYVKFSQDFSWHRLGIKMLLFQLPNQVGWIIMGGGGDGFQPEMGGSAPNPRISSRTGGAISAEDPLIRDEVFPFNVSEPPAYQRGQWMRREFYFRMNTPGVADGAVRMQIDGVLVTNYEEVNFGITQDAGWGQVQYGMTWGGGGSAVPQDQTIRIAHFRLLTPP